MYKIIQTVLYDDGKHLNRSWYTSFKDFYKALDACHEMSCRNAEKNQRTDSIPVIYSVEYAPELDPTAVA